MFRTLRFYHSFFKFLSTPSARRATVYIIYTVREVQISIHALREEGDGVVQFFTEPTAANFYPRPPRGGRPFQLRMYAGRMNFYPRPPRGGRRVLCGGGCVVRHDFYPRPPRGGRLYRCSKIPKTSQFLSTPSARRATQHKHQHEREHNNFYPRPPRGGRHIRAR